MRAISAKYEKPYQGRAPEYAPETLWRFVVTTDGEMPHGHPGFGGLLRKEALSGQWQARHFENTQWGPGADDRLQAIQLLIPEVERVMKAHNVERVLEDQERNARAVRAARLNEGLNSNIRVSHSNQFHIDRPDEYEIKITGLQESDVRIILDALKSVGR